MPPTPSLHPPLTNTHTHTTGSLQGTRAGPPRLQQAHGRLANNRGPLRVLPDVLVRDQPQERAHPRRNGGDPVTMQSAL